MGAIGSLSRENNKWIGLLKILFFIVSIIALMPFLVFPTASFSVYFYWIVFLGVICCFIALKPEIPYKEVPIIRVYLFMYILYIPYSLYMAEDYWDMKELIENLMIYLIPLCVYKISTPNRLVPILSFWYRYCWIIFLFFLIPFIKESDAIGKFNVPFTFALLFFSCLNGRMKILSLGALALMLLFNLDDRSDSIKMIVCLLLGLIPYFKFFRKIVWPYKLLRILAFLLPFILLVLGVAGVFNVFDFESYMGDSDKYTVNNKQGNDESLLADSRTILYSEAVTSAVTNDYVLQGRSMSRGYDSPFFAYLYDTNQYTGRYGERRTSESLLLTVFTYFGIFGVVIFFIIFWIATSRAISNSNNIYIKMLGLYMCFRWVWLWIEDYARVDANTLLMWFMLAMCFSPYWRNLSNEEFKKIIKSV